MSWPKTYKQYDPKEEGYGNAQEWRKAFYQRLTPEEAREILDDDDPYVVLGIKHGATKTEIKKAYFTLAKKWHPDRNPEDVAGATEIMKKINAAYSLLS